jgi:hypothetical protein
MCETLSIFVGSGPSIDDCRNLVENNLETHLVQKTDSEGHLFEGNYLGVCVALFNNHGLVDDCGIEFTQFPLEIDFTHYAGTNTRDWNEATFLRSALSLAERLSKQLRTRCLVVQNLQRIVQSFVQEDGEKNEKGKGTGPLLLK